MSTTQDDFLPTGLKYQCQRRCSDNCTMCPLKGFRFPFVVGRSISQVFPLWQFIRMLTAVSTSCPPCHSPQFPQECMDLWNLPSTLSCPLQSTSPGREQSVFEEWFSGNISFFSLLEIHFSPCLLISYVWSTN